MSRLLILFALVAIFPAASQAELSVPKVFSDHMVLQLERPAAIWGNATPGAEVTVKFKDNRSTVRAKE